MRGALLATGAFLPVLSIARARQMSRLDARPASEPALVTLLAGIPIFAPLSESALEHLASALAAVALPAGVAVISQGERGDGFYVVEDGELESRSTTSTCGNSAPGVLREIALLRDVPRTATVRTLTGVRLQRLDRAPFIGTVTGNTMSSEAADAVVGSRLGLRSGFTSV